MKHIAALLFAAIALSFAACSHRETTTTTTAPATSSGYRK